MKKTLFIFSMVLGVATVFAQIPKTKQVMGEAPMVPATPKSLPAAPAINSLSADTYKGSIFTKEDATPIFSNTFSTSDSATFDVGPNHTVLNSAGRFVWMRDTLQSTFESTPDGTSGSKFSYIYSWLGGNNIFRSPSAGGFLLISPWNVYRANGGYTGIKFNAWANVTRDPISTTGVEGVYVQFFQRTQRFNQDKYFVEYSVNGTTWDSIEINIRGIEMESNTATYDLKKVTLPAKAGNQPSLEIRFRYTGFEESVDGTQLAAGYVWMIDDVNVFPAPAQGMAFRNENYGQGFYHMIPRYVNPDPIQWTALFTNTGIQTLSSVKAVMMANEGEVFSSNVIPELPIGAIDTLKYISSKAAGQTANFPTGANVPSTYQSYMKLVDGATTNPVPSVYGDTFNIAITSSEKYYNSWARDNGVLVSGNRFIKTVKNSVIVPDTTLVNTYPYTLGMFYRTDSTASTLNDKKMYLNGVQLVSSSMSRPGTTIRVYITWTENVVVDGQDMLRFNVISWPYDYKVKAEDIATMNPRTYTENYPVINIPALDTVIENGNITEYVAKGIDMTSFGPGAVFGAWYQVQSQETNNSAFYIATDVKGQLDYYNLPSYSSYFGDLMIRYGTATNDMSYYTMSGELPMIRLVLSETQIDTIIRVVDSIQSTNDFSAESFKLNNYPNPAKEQTTISYTLVKSGNVTLEVRDIMGRLVKTVAIGNQAAQAHNYVLNTAAFKNGTYFYTLKVNGISNTKKMLIQK